MLAFVVLLLVAAASPAFGAAPKLEQYNVDPASLTVSGLSSGAVMAHQYHVVHSASVSGAAIFAGVPYHCAKGLSLTALSCMSNPEKTTITDLINQAIDNSGKGKIDGTNNLSGDKVFVFAGSLDSVVLPLNGQQLIEFYQYFGAAVQAETGIAAEHCQPTDFYGPSCSYLGGEYINDCAYNGAFEGLNYLYGGSLTRPDASVVANGQFLEFNQIEFYPLSLPGTYSADTTGFIYIPSGCVDKTKTCKLHFAFHGCQQGRSYVGDSYARNSGYLEVAEANDIIVGFPQVEKDLVLNPQGCWDWWGYAGITIYDTLSGIQIKATEDMINRIING